MKLIQAFQKEYRVTPLSRLRVRDVFQIRTAEWGVVCLKPMRNSVEAEFVAAVLTYLRQSGFHLAPKVFLTKNQTGYWTVGDATYMVTSWTPGTHPNFEKFRLVRDAATTLAQFHCFSVGLPTAVIPESKWKVNQLASQVTVVRNKIEGTQEHALKPLLSFAKEAFESITTNSSVISAIEAERDKRAFIHGDYNYPNLIRADGRMNLIDFDNTSVHVRVRDLTHLIQRNCLYKAERTKRVIDAYNSVRSLTLEELALLKALLKVPFTVTRSLAATGTLRKTVLTQIPPERQIARYYQTIDRL